MAAPRDLRRTHTLALMELSPAAYQEVFAKLKEADYHHAIDSEGTLDMSGIGVIQRIEPDQGKPPAAAPATSLDHAPGWTIDNGKDGTDRRYRVMGAEGSVGWTANQDNALRFSRRSDAESFATHDEDAWDIRLYVPPASAQALAGMAPGGSAAPLSNVHPTPDQPLKPLQLSISTTGFKAEVLQRLKEPGSAGTLSAGPGVAPPNELESRIRHALSQHLKRYARDDGNVTLTVSVSLSYP